MADTTTTREKGSQAISGSQNNLAIQTDVDLWKKARATVEEKIGPHKFNLWLNNSALLSFDASGDQMNYKIGLPNLFVQEWVASNYKKEIEEALAATSGLSVKTTFCVDPALFSQSRAAQHQSTQAFEKSEKARKGRQSGLRKSYTLSSFVVCPSNQMAVRATRDAVEQLGNLYNPLFIYGATGLGKTHLIQAALKEARARHQNIRGMYVSCEQFVNQFILSMKSGTLSRFREQFRKLDLLIIDDIHVLSKKDATQSEFLYTLNELDTAVSQIVITSDSHPKQLGNLRRQLVDRFLSGMVVRLESPNIESRIKILQAKALAVGKEFEPGVIERIARRVTKNVRELEAALTRIIAFEAVSGKRVPEQLVGEILGDGFTPHSKGVNLKDVEDSICTDFGITPAALKERSRKRSVILPRQLAMYLARELTDHSLAEIGRYFGGRNHTTVMFACRRVDEAAGQDGQIRRVINNLRATILAES